MRTDSEHRAAGMSALTSALGLVEAERVIASLSRESFVYTEWRRIHLPQGSVAQISSAATGVWRNCAPFSMQETCTGLVRHKPQKILSQMHPKHPTHHR